MFGQSEDLQKSRLGEVWTYKNQVWARSALTKIGFGRSRDLQKSYLGDVETYSNQVWAKSGVTKIRFGQGQDFFFRPDRPTTPVDHCNSKCPGAGYSTELKEKGKQHHSMSEGSEQGLEQAPGQT